jgi:hypothetical protein
MNKVIIFLTLLFGVQAEIKSCSSVSALAKNLVVSATEPIPGQNMTITFDYDLESVVTGWWIFRRRFLVLLLSRKSLPIWTLVSSICSFLTL